MLESEETAAGRQARVDAAVVALLFCGALRRAEAAALVWADVEPTERPDQLRVRASKANPTARGAVLGVGLGGARRRRVSVAAVATVLVVVVVLEYDRAGGGENAPL